MVRIAASRGQNSGNPQNLWGRGTEGQETDRDTEALENPERAAVVGRARAGKQSRERSEGLTTWKMSVSWGRQCCRWAAARLSGLRTGWEGENGDTQPELSFCDVSIRNQGVGRLLALGGRGVKGGFVLFSQWEKFKHVYWMRERNQNIQSTALLSFGWLTCLLLFGVEFCVWS